MWIRPSLLNAPRAVASVLVAVALGAAPEASAETPSPQISAPAAPVVAPRRVPGTFAVGLSARATAGRASAFAVDRGGARAPSDPEVSSRLTLRFDVDSGDTLGTVSLGGRVAVDVASGTFVGKPAMEGDKLPGTRYDAVLPMALYGSVALKGLGLVRAGLMTSLWGVGLVANDGYAAFDGRRDAWFSLPLAGDRVARVLLALTPMGRSESPMRGLSIIAAADKVIEDSVAIYADGDRANQAVGALRFHLDPKRWAGLYYVLRDQTFASGRFLRAQVLDATAEFDLRQDGQGLRVQAEGAFIFGRTSLAPTPEFPDHDLRQAAGVAKLRYDLRAPALRFELDAGWFSGDDNMDDGTLTAFKANPNYQQGILLFQRVIGWQSGRARLTASNPLLVGKPADDLDRLATNGSVTSALTIFPKIGFRHSDLLEVYAGALLAFAPTPPIDPLSTRTLGGGEPRNYLSKKPDGALLGTELDLGLATTVQPWSVPLALDIRAEYGVLLPGGALAGLDTDGPIHGGRLTIGLVPPRAAK